jgi:hypothetical protein
METLLSAPYFQVTLAAVVGIGVVALGLAVAVTSSFCPAWGRRCFPLLCPRSEKEKPK